jgi:hypothetical protein
MRRENVDLLAYHDLDRRSGLKVAMQELDGPSNLYVTGSWHSGWSILKVNGARVGDTGDRTLQDICRTSCDRPHQDAQRERTTFGRSVKRDTKIARAHSRA